MSISKEDSDFLAKLRSPYEIPAFNPTFIKPEVRYYWWSWHPNYPTWSKYSKGYSTQEEAWEDRDKDIHSSLDYYYNKLVREGDGQYTVVAENPCRLINVWWDIFEKNKK